jgi:hypothetical protein
MAKGGLQGLLGILLLPGVSADNVSPAKPHHCQHLTFLLVKYKRE